MESIAQISKEILDVLKLRAIDYNSVIYKGPLVDHNLAFPMDEIISGIHGTVGLLISRLWEIRKLKKQNITVEIPHAYLSPSSVFLIRLNHYPIYPWDPVYPTVGLYQTKDDRHIFINGGHPKLRDRILKVLNVPNDKEIVLKTIIKNWDAIKLEEAIAEANSCAAMVRTKEEWLGHPHGKILNSSPLIKIRKISDTKAENFSNDPKRPLSGVKVLDLTSVVAAPTSARIMAEHGADVLHISAPHLSFIPPFLVETGNGKREAYLDLNDESDLGKFKELLSQADVFIEGWRPGIMAKYGLLPEEVQRIRPGIIHLTLSCYGEEGPFSQRAGWEQLGQAVSGIIASNYVEQTENLEEKGCGEAGKYTFGHAMGRKRRTISDTLHSHGLLVCDYTTGILGSLGVLASLIKRSSEGGGYHIHLSLSRSGMWLISKSSIASHTGERLRLDQLPELYKKQYCQSSKGPLGQLDYLSPVVRLSETNPFFAIPSSPLGSSIAEWL